MALLSRGAVMWNEDERPPPFVEGDAELVAPAGWDLVVPDWQAPARLNSEPDVSSFAASAAAAAVAAVAESEDSAID